MDGSHEPTGADRKADLRDYLAAERTLLAWVRTGIAAIALGFVVARFGVFLQEIRVAQRLATRSSGLSLLFGIALIATGVVVNLAAAAHHARLVRELDRGEVPTARPMALHVGIAVVLALFGVAMIAYLLVGRNALGL